MLLRYRAVIPPRSSLLAPLLAGLVVGAILAGARLTLAVDAPQSALLDGARGASAASVTPTVDVAPPPLPAAAAPYGGTDGAAPRPEPGTLTLPPPTLPPPKVAPTDPVLPAAGPATAQAPTRSARQASRATIAAVVEATNAERVAAGCRALRVDHRLDTAAQRHSVDMAKRKKMSHIGADGSTFTDRIRSAGYPRPGAENIAFGQPTAASVVAAWMSSSGHRRNILNCSYTTIGVGFDPRGNYWTQNFGR
ncbi:MAG: CAP domain-containing protein [Pseudonocardiales bacterium]